MTLVNGNRKLAIWIAATAGILLPICVLVVNIGLDIERRVDTIEGNRFTANEATAMRADIFARPTRTEIQADLNEIKQMIRDLNTTVERLR